MVHTCISALLDAILIQRRLTSRIETAPTARRQWRKKEFCMAIMELMENVVHQVKIWLHPANLPTAEQGELIARSANEKTLDLEQICSSLKERGGSTATYEDLVAHGEELANEIGFLLVDGFAINFCGLFRLWINVGGVWNSATERWNRNKHPITVHFQTLGRLKKAMDKVEVEVLGLAPEKRYLAKFIDIYTGDENMTISRGHIFTLEGYMINVAGTGNGEGVWFVNLSTATRIQVTEISENRSKVIRGLIPTTLSQGQWTIEVVTRSTSSTVDILLKEPRTITLPHRLLCMGTKTESASQDPSSVT
jgi:hypothetical protein